MKLLAKLLLVVAVAYGAMLLVGRHNRRMEIERLEADLEQISQRVGRRIDALGSIPPPHVLRDEAREYASKFRELETVFGYRMSNVQSDDEWAGRLIEIYKRDLAVRTEDRIALGEGDDTATQPAE